MTQPQDRKPTWEEEQLTPPTEEEISDMKAEEEMGAAARREAPAPRKLSPGAERTLALEYDQATGLQLQPPQVQALLAYGQRYNLDPYARHVMILHGAPYLTEVGAIAHARRDARYRGYSCRNLQPKELEKLGEEAGSWGWLCSIWMDGYKEPIEDWGIVTHQEVEYMTDEIRQNVETDPKWRNLSESAREREIARRCRRLPLLSSPSKMARARAVRRAHERAVPLDRPLGLVYGPEPEEWHRKQATPP